MCGLIGIASNGQTKLSPEIVPFMFNHLMQINDSRGGDSYGFMFIDPLKKGPTSYKIIGTHQATARGSKTWHKGLARIATAVKNQQPFIVIGHNRRATTGKVSIRNQHPFQMGKLQSNNWIIGAHNGMLSRHEKVAETLDIKNHYEVDSEVIFRAILKKPDSPLEVLGELDPVCVMSLVYMMSDFTKLHLYRGSNPLSIAEHNGLLLWNSENSPLDQIVSGVNMDTKILTKDSHYTFNVTTGELGPSKYVKPTYELSRSIREVDQTRWQHGSKDYVMGYDGWYGPLYEVNHPSTDVTVYKNKGSIQKAPIVHKASPSQKVDEKIELYTSMFDIDVGQERELLPIGRITNQQGQQLDTCVVCGLADPITGLQSCANAATLLHHDGQAFCGTCYYFTVQQAAEDRIMASRREQYKSEDTTEKTT